MVFALVVFVNLHDEVCDEGFASSNEPDASCRTDCQRRRCGDGTMDVAAGKDCGDGECNEFLESPRLCPEDCGDPALVCGDFFCDSEEDAVSCPGDCTL